MLNGAPTTLQPVTPGIRDIIQDDKQVITETAARVRNLLAQANITEKRIAIGAEFKALRHRLPRWRTALDHPNPFVFSRRSAENHIELHEAFGHLGNMLPTLPHAFRALHLLATFKLSDFQLKSKCLSGEISPNSTEGEIWKLGAALGKVQPKPAIKKSKSKTPVLSKEAWDRLSQGKRKKLARDIGLKELLDAYSPTVAELLDAAGTKRCNELWKRAKGQLIELGAPETKVLALPAPAQSSILNHDLDSAWDAATADERQNFARERENEVLDAF
jgi:hypothetical protein